MQFFKRSTNEINKFHKTKSILLLSLKTDETTGHSQKKK